MNISRSQLKRIRDRLYTNGRNSILLAKHIVSIAPEPNDRQILFADISNPSFERYLYLLLKYFEIAGIDIHLRFNLNLLLNLRNYNELILNLRGFKIVLNRPETALITVTDHLPVGQKPIIQISTDYFRPEVRKTNDFVFPYQMHPMVYETGLYRELRSLRIGKRDISIFCSGNTGEAYNNSEIATVYDKLNRKEITEFIESEFSDQCGFTIYSNRNDRRIFEKADGRPFVMFKNFTVELREWVQFLARSDFFIAPPGMCMPFSHNIIEAMAIGTIPITEYPEMFDPPLEDRVNCLTFKGKAGIRQSVKSAMSLSDKEIQKMRANVICYYDEYIEPVSVIGKLISRLPNVNRILINSEHLSFQEVKKARLIN